jgi:glycosyltransferase involved in cell wall biosynthesis
MKLLILDQFSDPGGAQQALLELLPAFRDHGWDVTVGLPGAGPLIGQIRDAGFPVESIECGPYASGRKTFGDLARFLLDTPSLAARIASLARDADVVCLNGPRLLPAAALARLDAPVMFHAHSFLGPGPLRRLAGRALRHMRATVIANCEFVAAPWRKYAADVQVIYNGVADVGLTSGGRTGPPRVACLGRIAQEKGQLEFLAAAERIYRERPDCHFTIYGAALFSESGAEQYDRDVRARSVGLPVEFAGWIDEVGVALSQTDILLVPSTPVEATTRVILEAYSAGVPVIALANGGIPEVVENGRSGFLVRSVEEMADAAVQLLADADRRAAMSAMARELWERRFTLERFRREIAAALETVRRRPAPAAPRPPAPDRTRIA